MTAKAACGLKALVMLVMLFVAEQVRAQQPVKFLLDGRIEGPDAPFLVALDSGYYKAEGLSVTINPGNGTADVMTQVASGAQDLGLGDINALIRFKDKNPGTGVKAVFMVYNKPPFAIIGRRSRGVSVPKDLEGRNLGAPRGEGAADYWPIFADVNGVDITKVKVENIGAAVREPMLAAGELDAIAGSSISSYVSLKDRGVPANDLSVLAMADNGVKLYGSAIIVNSKFAAEKPDTVRAFLRAYLKGLKEAAKRPAVAVESILKRSESARREVELERLRLAVRHNILTAEVKANGLGAVDKKRLVEAIDQLAIIHTFKNPRPRSEDIFDANYLPNPALRRIK